MKRPVGIGGKPHLQVFMGTWFVRSDFGVREDYLNKAIKWITAKNRSRLDLRYNERRHGQA
jgi:hypothetical protein